MPYTRQKGNKCLNNHKEKHQCDVSKLGSKSRTWARKSEQLLLTRSLVKALWVCWPVTPTSDQEGEGAARLEPNQRQTRKITAQRRHNSRPIPYAREFLFLSVLFFLLPPSFSSFLVGAGVHIHFNIYILR